MKEFDLKEAKAGKHICTRNGKKVHILKFDAKGDYSLIGYFEDFDEIGNRIDKVCCWKNNGKYLISYSADSGLDLFMAPEHHEKWMNVYINDQRYFSASNLWSNKETAINNIASKSDYVTTVKVEWDE